MSTDVSSDSEELSDSDELSDIVRNGEWSLDQTRCV